MNVLRPIAAKAAPTEIGGFYFDKIRDTSEFFKFSGMPGTWRRYGGQLISAYADIP
ncbi:MAG: hypothetical protein V3V50_02220 [Gammaproteobacteria bacterium]